MGATLFLYLQLIFFRISFSQPAFVYDGNSVEILQGQQNWTLKYKHVHLSELDECIYLLVT